MWGDESGVEVRAEASDPEVAQLLLRFATLGWQADEVDTLTSEAAEDFGAFEGTPPQVVLMPDGRKARLLQPIAYTRPDGSRWPVPKDAELDGASIPRVFWTVIGGPFEGKYRDASIVHDYYCDVQTQTWRNTHRMFFEAMRCSGVAKAKAKIMYYAVYRFGPRWGDPTGSAPEIELAPTADKMALESFVCDAEAIAAHSLNLEEIEALADARNEVDSVKSELLPESGGRDSMERAKRLVITGGGGTADDLNAVAAEAARLPQFVLTRFEKKKVRIVACRSAVTDFEADLRGVTPRGWDGTGRTWDDVPGAYFSDRKRVVIATVDEQGARVVPSKASGLHGSASLAVHESLHGYDYIGGHEVLRDIGFVTARRDDLVQLGAYERQEGQAGLEETYAESGARFAAEPDAMRTDWPNLHTYWNRQFSSAPEMTSTPEVSGLDAAPASTEVGSAAVGTAQYTSDGTLLLDLRAEGIGGAIGHALLRIPPSDPSYSGLATEIGLRPELASQDGASPMVFRAPKKTPLPPRAERSASQPRVSPLEFIRTSEVGEIDLQGPSVEADGQVEPLNLDKLPNGVVSGTTLIDFTNVASADIRAGVSLSMLFASRVATKAMKPEDDEDDWLAAYTSNLSQLGYSLTQSSVVQSKFKKVGAQVHKAIIPFLTLAFGGAAVGPVILEGLRQLQEMDTNSPWITLFDRETRRFDIRELHFAAVSSNNIDTSIRYAIARLNVASDQTNILFFKITKNEAKFESVTRTMAANNSLLAVIEPDLRERLGSLTKSFIMSAEL